MKRVVIGIVVGVAITLVVIYAPRLVIPATETPETTETHIYIDGKIVVGGDGEPIELINNPNATDPTYAELLAFLEADQTDKYSYILGPPKVAYVCADFARDVHNNAEAAGIRAAWVGIDIEGKAEGHALNAFQTTDRGPVFVDCTGVGLWDEVGARTRWDRRAYVEEGQPYAIRDIDRPMTKFKFFIYVGQRADTLSDILISLEAETLGRLEELGWLRLRTYEERSQRSQQLLEWLRSHSIEELGMNWTQEWIQQHEAELYGREFEIDGAGVGISDWESGAERHVTHKRWAINTEALGGSWFEPDKRYWYGTVEEEVIIVDEIPVLWQVTWHMDGWRKPFQVFSGNDLVLRGAVEDIHRYWGE